MENLSIEKFNPTKEQLLSLVEECQGIEINGIEDKEGLARCKESRIKLRTARTTLEKIGKELRAEALLFQKAVIVREKELIGIVEPMEKELKAKEDEIERLKILEERKKGLPERIAEYEALGTGNSIPEEVIMSYDDEGRKTFILELKAKILEEKERKLKEEQEKMEVEKREMERAKEIEQAKKEAEEKARLETEARLKREAEEKERKEKEEAEKREMEAKKAEEERQKNEKYQSFVAYIGFNEGEDIKIEKDGVIKFYKFIGSYPL